MVVIGLRQIDHSNASEGAVVLYNGLTNVWSNNDDGAVLVSSGTTAQRPSTPSNGMIRYNQSLNCLEAYVNGAWVSQHGSIFRVDFSYDSKAKNVWLGVGSSSVESNQAFCVFPWSCQLIAITFSNFQVGADIDLELRSFPQASSPASATLKFTWVLRNIRSARNSNISPAVTFNVGDNLGIFARDQGTDVDHCYVACFFRVIDLTSGSGTNNSGGSISS